MRTNNNEIAFPDYPWMIIKSFLLKKTHPTAKLIQKYAFYYSKPKFFMSYFFQLKNGMFVKMEKPCLQIIPYSLETSKIPFQKYVQLKRIRNLKT